MCDVVATLWATAAIFFARPGAPAPAWALACGAAFGLAVLVRPTNLLARRCRSLFAIPLTLPMSRPASCSAALPAAAASGRHTT